MAKEPEIIEGKPLPWEERFLDTLRTAGNITVAARSAGITRQRAYQRREENIAFRVAWDEALEEALDLLEAEAARRAAQGVRKPVLFQGRQVMVRDDDGQMAPLYERQYSDTLLIFLLKAGRPQKFRERVQVELQDPMESLSETLAIDKDRLRLAIRGGAILADMEKETESGDDDDGA